MPPRKWAKGHKVELLRTIIQPRSGISCCDDVMINRRPNCYSRAMDFRNLVDTIGPDILTTRSPGAIHLEPQDSHLTECRREPRHACSDPAEVQRIPLDGSSFPATVLDISISGLGITLDAPLCQGSRIEVRLSRQVMFGKVRHCRRIGKVFRAGIVIEAVFYSEPLRG